MSYICYYADCDENVILLCLFIVVALVQLVWVDFVRALQVNHDMFERSPRTILCCIKWSS